MKLEILLGVETEVKNIKNPKPRPPPRPLLLQLDPIYVVLFDDDDDDVDVLLWLIRITMILLDGHVLLELGFFDRGTTKRLKSAKDRQGVYAPHLSTLLD